MINLTLLFHLIFNPIGNSRRPGDPNLLIAQSQQVEAQAQLDQATEAVRAWDRGEDSAVTLAILRKLHAETRVARKYYVLEIAHVLQAEGRVQEAADWYWTLCRISPDGRRSEAFINPNQIVRIFDCLEDAGRRQDATWFLSRTKFGSRRDLYSSRGLLNADHPLWIRKWALKLLDDNPRDEEALAMLSKADERLSDMKDHPGGLVTRDLPFDGKFRKR